MSNVVSLFRGEKVQGSRDSESPTPIPVAKFVASIAALAPAIRELSAQLDAIDGLIKSLGDPDAQKQMMQTQKIIRESLILATRELSREVKRLINRKAAYDLWRRPCNEPRQSG
jgi:hypothetical protein